MLLRLVIAAALVAGPVAAQDSTPASQRIDPYFAAGQAALKAAQTRRPNTRRAKNVILFVGDGMGLSTVVASRIYDGQRRGVDGPSNSLSFERLPYLALSKTYSHDFMTPDSAATATALLSGVKTRTRSIGVDSRAPSADCAASKGTEVESLATLAKRRGKAAGVVTTTRITHATPAAAYAHTPHRDWEADSNLPAAAKSQGCIDIARQLVEAPAAARLDVALGGGAMFFLPDAVGGRRKDGRDLMQTWTAQGGKVVLDADELAAAPPNRPLLGLFGPDHLPYPDEPAAAGVPTLAAMTETAIRRLSADRDGFFLLVEGGKIDHANHANQAGRAMVETIGFADAISAALRMVDLKDTLIVVTADHSHGLVISGYPARNASILGLSGDEGAPAKGGDGKPFTVLSYATGPGGPRGQATRRDPTGADLTAPDYQQDATVHLPSGAHSGEDVVIFAGGPQAHLLEGVVEENVVYHVMRRAFGF